MEQIRVKKRQAESLSANSGVRPKDQSGLKEKSHVDQPQQNTSSLRGDETLEKFRADNREEKLIT